jgi:ATP-citrate lyase alpha-subunit
MSILINEKTRVLVAGGTTGTNAVRRMGEFCHLVRRDLYVDAFVNPQEAGQQKTIPVGTKMLQVPTYGSVTDACKARPEINTALIYVTPRRAFEVAREALTQKNIKLVSMITEGVPKYDAKRLIKIAHENKKIFNGPSSIGMFSGGECRLGVAGGEYRNLVLSKLYCEGSFGVITKSGGLLNEAIWMAAQHADGITTAIAIGGDTYPGTGFVEYLEMFEKDPKTRAVILIGELGGDLEEQATEWFAAKKRRIKVIGIVSGFCQEVLPKGMKFGHAGAKEGEGGAGGARSKTDLMRKAGIITATTFGELGRKIDKLYKDLLKAKVIKPVPDIDVDSLPKLPVPVEQAQAAGEVLIRPWITNTITKDVGDLAYGGYRVKDLIDRDYFGVAEAIGLLWGPGRLLSKQENRILNMILFLSADHGPNVSGAYTAITGACAGIPLPQAVAAGISMIGPRFGGAVEGAARAFSEGVEKGMTPQEFVNHWTDVRKAKIMGIGHLKYDKNNPDPRVQKMVEQVRKWKMSMPVLDFALAVQDVTPRKADTLILNWDGAIGCVLSDLGFPAAAMNGFFVLARTIGFIGHWLDQTRRRSGLLRLPYTQVSYGGPDYVEPKQIDKNLKEAQKDDKARPATTKRKKQKVKRKSTKKR